MQSELGKSAPSLRSPLPISSQEWLPVGARDLERMKEGPLGKAKTQKVLKTLEHARYIRIH